MSDGTPFDPLWELIKSSPIKQVFGGAVGGWICAVLVLNLGANARSVIGGGIICLELAQCKNIIQYSPWIVQVTDFANTYQKFACGYIGGFILGLTQ